MLEILWMLFILIFTKPSIPLFTLNSYINLRHMASRVICYSGLQIFCSTDFSQLKLACIILVSVSCAVEYPRESRTFHPPDNSPPPDRNPPPGQTPPGHKPPPRFYIGQFPPGHNPPHRPNISFHVLLSFMFKSK